MLPAALAGLLVSLGAFAASLFFSWAATAEPVFLPGAHWGLTPPPGFTVETRPHAMFVHPAGAIIIVVTTAQPHDPSRFAAVGSVVGSGADQGRIVAIDEIQVGGRPAHLMRMRMAAADAMALLVRGESSGTVSATIFDEARPTVTDAAVRDALLSTVERIMSPAEQIAALPIDIADFGGLRITVTLSNSGVMMTDGPSNESDSAPGQPFVTVVALPPEAADGYRLARDPDAFANHIESVYKGVRVTGRQSGQGANGPHIELVFRQETDSFVRPGVAWSFVSGRTLVLVVVQLAADQQNAAADRFVRLRDSISER
ncbi:hypothetical protein [Mesorhizobium sp.]|uniref:hypothetical protein n=1 Tax=Mesorhizobium sp. TaxID=1871066 RepID=UPI000FE5B07A|nr:hypothetical protein [Mesorhizobium sp.]RWK49928.1 MAG: hypothetical protein EOR48_28025 [Mesorhizobium sp.]TIP41506.1 MAG: hypothetical protein E5X62_25060 [Mesorhizobium sp.]